jgi:hypothetical protein
MKNGYVGIFVIGLVLLAVSHYLAYRLGISNHRTETAEAAVAQVAAVRKTDQEITQRVMATADDDNLDWLLQNWLRAD